MKITKQINKKSSRFFNDMTSIVNFDLSLTSIDRISFESNKSIYEIKYIKNVNSSNSLYLVFNNLDILIKENGKDKSLFLAPTDKNESALKNYTEVWNEIKEQIKLIRDNKTIQCSKDFTKTEFEANDDLPLNKILNAPVCVITVNSVNNK